MTIFSARRVTMVDTQVRPSDVTKYPIIAAMLDIRREVFVPEALREAAYIGANLPLGPNRVLLEARTLAKMLDALDVQPSDLVLDIAVGLGYSSAVIARMAEAVVAVEDDAQTAQEAQTLLSQEGADNAIVLAGPLVAVAAKHGPYDVMLIQGGVEQIPQPLLDQLKEGGRIVALFMEDAVGVCRIGQKIGGHIHWRDAFNAAAPVLPGFARETVFAL